MSEEEEYEVESITQARVEGKKGRGKGLVWKYCVRWKGYGPDDDTWEPVKSFEGSQDIVNRFWERANVGGRDHRNISLFNAGEEFLPTGPPRRKVKRTSQKPGVVPSSPISPLPETPQKLTENKRLFGQRSDTLLGDSADDRPRKRIRNNAPNRAQNTISPPEGSGRVSLPRHPNRISIDEDVDPVGSPSHRQQKKGFRSSSFDEIVPASDDEVDTLHETLAFHTQLPPLAQTSFQIQHVSRSPRLNIAGGSSIVLNTSNSGDQDIGTQDDTGRADAFDPLFDKSEEQLLRLPSHRARVANPLVKMAEDVNFAGMSGAISVKTRLAGHKSAISPTSSGKSRKPGPGRSSSGLIKNSLLTFQKGSLKTVKGSYKKQTQRPNSVAGSVDDRHNDEPMMEGENVHQDEEARISNNGTTQVPPTAAELLGLAGLDAQHAEILSDFEEDASPTIEISKLGSQPLPPSLLPPDPAQLARQRSLASLALTKDNLFPSATTASATNTPSATWKCRTIFGELGLGSGITTPFGAESSRSSPFSLHLDSTVSIPVVLTHPLSSMETIVGKRGPPGKFYNQQAAMALLDTLRTGGPSGKVVSNTNTTDDQRTHFDRFCSRLTAGELFVAVAGMDVLAFCSSDNALISQRLNISPSLLGQPGEVLVSRVIIENHSAYADAAVNADSREWSRYLLSVA